MVDCTFLWSACCCKGSPRTRSWGDVTVQTKEREASENPAAGAVSAEHSTFIGCLI